jgi:methyl-accepting chemotaxis protein
LLVTFFLRDLGTVFESASYSTVNTVPSLLVLDRASDALTAIRLRTWEHVGTHDAAMQTELERRIAEAKTDLGASLKDYEPLLSDDKDKAMLQADRGDRDAIIAMSDKVIALSNAGKKTEAAELISSQHELLHKATLDFEAHRRYNETLGKQGVADAEAVKSHSLLWVMSLAALTMGAIGALGYLIVRQVTGQIGGEPAAVAAVANRVATGDFSSVIRLSSGDSTSLYATVARMQDDLRARQEADRAAAAEKERAAQELLSAATENSRVRTALDRVSVGVMLADNDGKVIYANDFLRHLFEMRAADIRTEVPQLDPQRIVGESFDNFHRDPSLQSNRLAGLTTTHTVDIRLGKASLRVTANPVNDAQGRRVGTVVQWTDRTQELSTEEEVNAVVAGAVDGDLTVRIAEEGKDGFFKTLAHGMNSLIGNMAEVMRQMASAAGEVSSGAEEISRGNLDLSQRTEEQASSLEETAASMEEMTTTVKNNADNAAQANQLASAAREQAERGGKVVGSAVTAMNEINMASKRIADIIGVIDDIAFQTNLLALNAAVEAARAGEQGRGFAVVASEVRNLASRSAGAAKEIKVLIQDSVSKVDEGATLVDQSGKSLNEIVSGVKKVTDVMAEITVSSREQASGIDQVNKAVTSMDAVTQQNAALVEQASAASQTLTEQAANLMALIARYKFDGGVGASSAGAQVRSSTVAKPAAPVAARTRGAPPSERRSASRPWSGKPAARASTARADEGTKTAKVEATSGDAWTEF